MKDYNTASTYRNSGAFIVPEEDKMPYPRLCAHRGFSAAMPENSLPSIAAAISLGAEEVEFDVRLTSDEHLISIHDPNLDRVSDGHGNVSDCTYEELRELDFGISHAHFHGIRIPSLEEILGQFAGHTVMNIHVKIWEGECPDTKMEEIVSLVRKYGCEKHAYFASNSDVACRILKARHPDLLYCVIWNGFENGNELVRRAISAGADKVQFDRSHVDEEAIRLAHENGIRCNLFHSDEPEDARRFLDMGIDTVLTNEYLLLKNALGF